MNGSFHVVETRHGITTGYLSLSKYGDYSLTRDRAKAHRFRSERDALLYLATLPNTEHLQLVECDGPPTSATFPAQRRRKVSYPVHVTPELVPFRFSIGQRIWLSIGAAIVCLMALALVMGW